MLHFVLDVDVELILRVSATPVLLHHSLDELLDANDFVVGLFLVEFLALPDEHLVLVVLLAWHSVLGSGAQDQEGVVLQLLEVKDRHGLVPVGVYVQSGLQLLLFLDNASVVSHLVDDWLCLDEVVVLKL